MRGERGAPPDPAEIDWSGTGLVSVFVRERLGGEPCLAGATERSAVQVHDPSRPRSLRSRFGEQIRRNRKLGYRVEALPGPETSVEQRTSFHAVYTETMRRAEAAERYLFEPEYFGTILGFERSWLLLCRSPEGATAAGGIAALSDGLLHYYLGGTAEAHLGDSPFKNVVEAMIELAGELGVTLNLGGGVRPGDGLEDFKRGFANGELPFRTHEIVCDPDAYRRLSERPRGLRLLPALPRLRTPVPSHGLLALLQSPDAPSPRTHRPLVLLAAVPVAGADRALVGDRDHASRAAGEQGGGEAAAGE